MERFGRCAAMSARLWCVMLSPMGPGCFGDGGWFLPDPTLDTARSPFPATFPALASLSRCGIRGSTILCHLREGGGLRRSTSTVPLIPKRGRILLVSLRGPNPREKCGNHLSDNSFGSQLKPATQHIQRESSRSLAKNSPKQFF